MPESPEPFSRVANVYRSLVNPNSGHVAQGAHSNDTRAEPGGGGSPSGIHKNVAITQRIQ